MGISGDDLYKCILGDDLERKVSILTDLKKHVKKDNVNLSSVPKYFESLSIVMDSNNATLQSLAFSLICHLVKRVSIQDNDGSLLLDLSFLVLPIIIPKLADAKHSVKIAAGRTLEAYWLSAAAKVDAGLIEFGLSNRNPLIINECVVWINHILTTINPYLKLDDFFGPLALILARYESERALIENVKTLFANYYDLKHNSLRKFELQRVLESHNVNTALRRSIMGTDAIINIKEPKPFSSKAASVPHDVEAPKLFAHLMNRPRSQDLNPKPSPSESIAKEKSPVLETATYTLEDSSLDDLLSSLPNYKFDTSIASIDVYDQSQLYRITSEMLPCFDNKESEKNWLLREKCILKLRSLLRGNAFKEFPQDTLVSIKELADPICKGLLSLRTTLSVNSCQLVKEMTYIFGEDFDSLSELFFPTLMKLCAATKHLTTTNAHVVVCAILAKCSFHSRISQRIIAAASDKSVNTRSYSAFWLQILLIRFCDTEISKSIFDIMDRVLSKLLSDPSSLVRQAAKECYRRYFDICPSQCSQLLKSLDPATVRALGRSMPELMALSKTAPMLSKRSRPSLKESIITKNKELRAKQSESRSSSRNFTRQASDHLSDGSIASDHERVLPSSSKQSKPASHYNLPLSSDSHSLPHYAQSTFSQRLSSNPNPRAQKNQHEHAKEQSLRLKYHLPDSTTKSLRRHEFDKVTSFDKKTDPLINFLSSNQDEFVREGVNLLRYAIIGDEDLSKEVLTSVRRISLSNPHLLRLLFEEGENLLSKTRQAFAAEDYIRLCAIILPLTERHINTIISVFDVDELYSTVTILLSYIADLDNIVDDKLLVMQIIKFKTRILDMLVKFLIHVSSLLPLSDVNFTKLTANLFDLVPIVHSMPSYKNYKDLLRKLYGINSVLFTSQLSVASKVSRSEVEQFVGIDRILHFNITDKSHFNPVSEFTEIAPGASAFIMSPLKQPSDFTMLMPVKSSEPDGPILLQDTVVKVEREFKVSEERSDSREMVCDDIIDEAPVASDEGDIVMGDTEKMIEEQEKKMNLDDVDSATAPEVISELLHSDGTSLKADTWNHDTNDLFQKDGHDASVSAFAKSLSSASSTELVDDFAQVNLTNPNNSIQSIIEKIDPLSKISSKNKPIFIFEDSKTGSPEKAKEYSYLELNWFNFLIAKLSLDSHFKQTEDFGIDEFKFLCRQLNQSTLTASQFSSLLGYMQNNQSGDFMHFLAEEGSQLFERSLWNSFHSKNVETRMNNLILLKQSLINKNRISLDLLWSILLALSAKCSDTLNEMRVALGEVFDEALRGSFSTADLTQVVINTMKNAGDISEKALSFSVECLYKLMSAGTLTLKINRDMVSNLINVLHPLINHHDTEIRKLSFQTYGRLMRAITVSGISNRVLSPEKSDNCLEDEMLINLSGPQKKLVEYFSHLSL